MADCLLWWPKLKPGGIFFGDDYMCRAQHGPHFSPTCVKDVVDTFAATAWSVPVKALPNLQWVIFKPNRPGIPAGRGQHTLHADSRRHHGASS